VCRGETLASMWSNLKSELGAAVAISAGLLVAAGYLFVWAQMWNADLPVQPILSALPPTAFISAALESLAVPVGVLLTGVAVVLMRRKRSDSFPAGDWWLWFGLALAFAGRFVTLLDFRVVYSGTDWTAIATSIVAGVVILLSVAAGHMIKTHGPAQADPGRRFQILAAAMLILAVLTVSAYRVTDALTVDLPRPYVGVFMDTADCPPVFDVFRRPLASTVTAEGEVSPAPEAKTVEEKRCYVGGFYVGESDRWIMLAGAKTNGAPGRLLLVPRDSAQLGAVATTPLDRPPRGPK
jgi:hypothetical protein